LYYVSITGLRLKGPRYFLHFWWHGSRAMSQALRAPGNLRAERRTINSVHHTLSVWTDEAAMRSYLATGSHRRALAAFRKMATGKTLGFLGSDIPDWSKVHAMWLRDGRDV
jgi:hypothetical protein